MCVVGRWTNAATLIHQKTQFLSVSLLWSVNMVGGAEVQGGENMPKRLIMERLHWERNRLYSIKSVWKKKEKKSWPGKPAVIPTLYAAFCFLSFVFLRFDDELYSDGVMYTAFVSVFAAVFFFPKQTDGEESFCPEKVQLMRHQLWMQKWQLPLTMNRWKCIHEV